MLVYNSTFKIKIKMKIQTKICLPWGVYLTTNFTVPIKKEEKILFPQSISSLFEASN